MEAVRKVRRQIANRSMQEVLRTFGPRVAASFRRAVKNIDEASSLSEIERAIEGGNFQEAMRLAGANDLAAYLSGDRVADAARRGRVPFDRSTTGLGAVLSDRMTVVEVATSRLNRAMRGSGQFFPESREALREAARTPGIEQSQAGQMVQRQRDLAAFIRGGNKVSLAELAIDPETNQVSFINGRNRVALARDTGARTVPVAIEVDDLERFRASGLLVRDPDASMTDELKKVFVEGAKAGRAQMPRSLALQASLDLTNPAALSYMENTLPRLIVEISDNTREAVQQALVRGFTEGRPARVVAREVRQAVGLTRNMEGFVDNFRRALRTGELSPRETLPWERRLSASERQQARSLFNQAASGRAPSEEKINALVERYRQSLINRRARNISRTEITRAQGEGQTELWRQAEQRGLIDPGRTRRFWIVAPDDRLRPSHASIPGMNPDGVGMREPFDTVIGPVMAPRTSGVAAFDINCRCTIGLEIDE